MPERPLSDMTLREMLTDAERLTREMIEHIEQDFIPKAHALRKLVRPTVSGGVDPEVEDITVRNTAVQALKSEKFTEELYQKLRDYCTAIDEAVSRIS